MQIGKVDFPRFGGEDLQGWMYKCDHVLAIEDTPELEKLRYAGVYLVGDALQWHWSYMKTRRMSVINLSWPEYVRAITSQFWDALLEDAMEELTSLI